MLKLNAIIISLLMAANLHATDENDGFHFYGKFIEVKPANGLNDFQFSTENLNFTKVNKQLKAMHDMDLDAVFTKLEHEAHLLDLAHLAYFQFLKLYSVKSYPNQSVGFRIALVWYGLRHRGIDALLAGKNNQLLLFVRLDQEIDGGYSLTHQGKKYQSATKGNIPFKLLEIYKPILLQDSAYDEIVLNPSHFPDLGNTIVQRSRNFNVGDQNYTLNTKYNQNRVDYMNDLPRFKIGAHLYQVNLSPEAENSINDSIELWLKGKSYHEKQLFLLTMVQNAFAYKADRDYRSHEKRNFAEQTLADDYVDCEDKAAFFCYLANKYLQAKTLLIYSKNNIHVNCAIEMNTLSPGYTFKYKNKPYLIFEPAFVGYKPGETDFTDEDFKEAVIFE
jgi:hypothetical protein